MLAVRLGIIKEMQPQYVATFSEKPAVLDGHPFVVEAGVSLGGSEVRVRLGFASTSAPGCTLTVLFLRSLCVTVFPVCDLGRDRWNDASVLEKGGETEQ